jgi:hypothetical protein
MLLGILNSQAAGGGGGAYDLLETTTLATSASSVTFSGLGSYSDYAHLQLRMVARGPRPSTFDGLQMNFNGDTSTNYITHYLKGNGTIVASGSINSSFNGLAFNPVFTSADSASGAFGAAVFDILDFSNSSKNTTVRGLFGSTDLDNIQLASGLFIDTSAVSSVLLAPLFGTDYNAGSRFSLYGIKGA